MIKTVQGIIGEKDLGVVAISECMLYAIPGWEDDPWLNFDRPKAIDKILTELRAFKRAGGKTIVDASGTLLGRDPEMLMALAVSAKVNILASTGFGEESMVPAHFLQPFTKTGAQPGKIAGQKLDLNPEEKPANDTEYLRGLLSDELDKGMVTSGMIRTGIKAGLIKTCCGTRMSKFEKLSIVSAALAAAESGSSVYVSDTAACSEQVLGIMLETGLSPDRIIIGHCDNGRSVDIKRDKTLARKGVFVAYDHVGWEGESAPHAMPDDERVKLVKAMVDAGFTGQVLLSCNAIGFAIGQPQTPQAFKYLLTDFVPKLKKSGIKTAVIDKILTENPARALSRKEN